MVTTNEWVWMPHPAHLCVADSCRFRLATYVNGVIVSTVGEYSRHDGQAFETVGLDRLYETMVFKAVPTTESECDACPYQIDVESGEIDFEGYNSARAAYDGHLALCQKWSASRAPVP